MNVLEALKNNGFETVDYIVVLVYIVILVGLGLFLSRGKKGQEKSSNDYFLAGNTLTWWAVGASLIAANISAEQFIGMSGSAFASGIAMAAYELEAALALIIVGKFLLPLMIKKHIFTIPQFLSERYNWGVGQHELGKLQELKNRPPNFHSKAHIANSLQKCRRYRKRITLYLGSFNISLYLYYS